MGGCHQSCGVDDPCWLGGFTRAVERLLDCELPISFGIGVVAEVVVDPGAQLVSLAVVLGMQWNRAVHVCQSRFPIWGGQECVGDGAVSVAHVMGWTSSIALVASLMACRASGGSAVDQACARRRQ